MLFPGCMASSEPEVSVSGQEEPQGQKGTPKGEKWSFLWNSTR